MCVLSREGSEARGRSRSMSREQEQEELDLLLSLQDRVLETPPASPSPHSPGFVGCLSDDGHGSPNHREKPDMSVFRDAVQDCLHYDPPKPKPKTKPLLTNDADVEKFSGLRIRLLPLFILLYSTLLSFSCF